MRSRSVTEMEHITSRLASVVVVPLITQPSRDGMNTSSADAGVCRISAATAAMTPFTFVCTSGCCSAARVTPVPDRHSEPL